MRDVLTACALLILAPLVLALSVGAGVAMWVDGLIERRRDAD